MKRILFDQQIFRKQKFGGISRYFTELMIGINRHEGYCAQPKKFYSDNLYLAGRHLTSFKRLSAGKNFKGKSKIEKLILKAENYNIASKLRNKEFEVFHPTYYDSGFLQYLPKNKPLVLTVHDMIHESYYDNMLEYLTEETKHKRKLINRADHIIAVSQYTKNEILKYFPAIDEKKISVIYHGVSLQPKTEDKKQSAPSYNYLLFVGIRKHYKNFFWLVRSLHDYLKQNNFILLCAGGSDFDTYEKDFIASLGLNGYIKHIPVNTDAEMIVLYENAVCFLFPSLIEGFGMPVLEAFICGCPAVIADSSCFPEIAGDAALYFTPGDNEGLLKKIDMIRNNAALKQELREKGMEKAKQFSWENTITQHINVYNSLLN
jgi:glycosyltransferase involved in cell wall biosynthesis